MQSRANKLLSPLIAVMMVIGLLSVMPFSVQEAEAADVPTIYASSATDKVGEIVDVTIGLENNPGIVLMRFQVGYDDSALRLVNVIDGGALGHYSHSDQLISPYQLLWTNGTATENFTTNGNLVTLQFEILSDKGSDITLRYNVDGANDIIDVDLKQVYFATRNGLVTVGEPTRYTVTFNAANGTAPQSVSVKEGKKVNQPANPVWENHDFLGWFVGDELFNFDSKISADVTLTAKWNAKIQYVEITTLPKVEYSIGEFLSLAGMVVTAVDADGVYRPEIGGSLMVTFPVDGAQLTTLGSQTVQVFYSVNGYTTPFQTTFTVTVNPLVTLDSIKITSNPTKTKYFVGETLDLGGLEVTANYSNGTSEQVTNYTTNPVNGAVLTSPGTLTIRIHYEGQTATFTVNAEYKLADYSIVDIAIAAANALNKDLYVDFSAVTAAINAVEYGLDVNEQATVDGFAAAINTAIANLVYKGANYSAVEAAITAANALNKDLYVDFSAVTAAINAVEYGLDVNEQATVDGYAAAINTAIANLVYKGANYAAVEAAITAANALNKDLYVDFSAVTAAINAVEYGLDVNEQATVDGFAAAIYEAIAALVEKVEQAIITVIGMPVNYQAGVQTLVEVSQGSRLARAEAVTNWIWVEEPRYYETDVVEFDVTGYEGPFRLWLGIKKDSDPYGEDSYPGIWMDDNIEADQIYDVSDYFYNVSVPEGVSNFKIYFPDTDTWYVPEVSEDNTICMLKTDAKAVADFDYEGDSGYGGEIVLKEEENPFSGLDDGEVPPNLQISGYVPVSSVRITLTDYDYTYMTTVTNNGGAAKNVRAKLVGSSQPTVTVLVPDHVLSFGNVSEGATVTSEGAFTVRVNRTVAFDTSKLVFTFDYDK